MAPCTETVSLDLAEVARRISEEGSAPTVGRERAGMGPHRDPRPVAVPDALVEQLTLRL